MMKTTMAITEIVRECTFKEGIAFAFSKITFGNVLNCHVVNKEDSAEISMENSANVTVMVIDDSPSVLSGCKAMLDGLGYQVICIRDSLQGILDDVEMHQPSVILMDVDLGGNRDGIDGATTILKLFAIPVIIMTGLSKEKLLENGQLDKLSKSGAVAFLQKPLTELALDQTIRLSMARQGKNQKGKLVEIAARLPYVLIKTTDGFLRLNIGDILYIKGGHNYCDIFCVGKKYIARNTLKDLQSKMSELLLQVHKGTLVNLLQIDRLDSDFSALIMSDKTRLQVGATFRKSLKDRLELL